MIIHFIEELFALAKVFLWMFYTHKVEFGYCSVLLSAKLFAAKLSLKCSLLILTESQRQVFLHWLHLWKHSLIWWGSNMNQIHSRCAILGFLHHCWTSGWLLLHPLSLGPSIQLLILMWQAPDIISFVIIEEVINIRDDGSILGITSVVGLAIICICVPLKFKSNGSDAAFHVFV